MATENELEKMQRADHDALIRVETKIDTFIGIGSDHEKRLRELESLSENTQGAIKGLRWFIGGMGTVIGLVEPFIIFYLGQGKQ